MIRIAGAAPGQVASIGAEPPPQQCPEAAAVSYVDRSVLDAALAPWDTGLEPKRFRRIESGRKLWNFSTHEPEMWKVAL